MSRFYFDIQEDRDFVADKYGVELLDLDAAELEAAKAAAELGCDKLRTGKLRKIVVDVRNEDCQRVLTATVSLEIDRLEPPPRGQRRVPHKKPTAT
jgi:hypothetical protein